MYNCHLVNKSFEPLTTETSPIPYNSEEKAVEGAGKLLKGMGCNIIWMGNINPINTNHLFKSENVVCVYSGSKDICVLIPNLILTGDDQEAIPFGFELGPFHLR